MAAVHNLQRESKKEGESELTPEKREDEKAGERKQERKRKHERKRKQERERESGREKASGFLSVRLTEVKQRTPLWGLMFQSCRLAIRKQDATKEPKTKG